MHNLLRVEINRLFTSKIFWGATIIAIIAMYTTFASFSGSMNKEIVVPGASSQGAEQATTQQPEGTLQEMQKDIEDAQMDIQMGIQEVQQALNKSENFIDFFYQSNNGIFIIVMVFTLVFIFGDFLRGTLGNTLSCGYSRNQIYMAKATACYIGGAAFIVLTMVTAFVLGIAHYNMIMTAGILANALIIMAGQLIILLEFVAIFCAIGFISGNGWSFLWVIGIFGILESGLLWLCRNIRIGGYDLISVLPSIGAMDGVIEAKPLEAMVSSPQLWSAGYVVMVLLTVALITISATIIGMKVFQRKQLS